MAHGHLLTSSFCIAAAMSLFIRLRRRGKEFIYSLFCIAAATSLFIYFLVSPRQQVSLFSYLVSPGQGVFWSIK